MAAPHRSSHGKGLEAAVAVSPSGSGALLARGLWDRWCGPDGGELESCVVLTTAPNDLLRRMHDRMPVLIPDGLEEAWLEVVDGPGLRALEPLMQPWDPAAWEAVRLEPRPAR